MPLLLLALSACPRPAAPVAPPAAPEPERPAAAPEVEARLTRTTVPLDLPADLAEAAPVGDGRWLLATRDDRVLRAGPDGVVTLGELPSPQALAASPDRRLAVAGGYGVVAAWDLDTGAPAWTWSHPENCRNVAWLPDGAGVLTAMLRDVTRHDPATGAPAWTWTAPAPTEHGRADTVSALAVSPDGRRVYTHADRVLLTLDAATGAATPLTTLGERIDALAVSPSGELVAAGLWDRTFVVLDAATGAVRHTFPASGWGEAVAWSPDGSLLALLDLERRVELRDLGGALRGAVRLDGASGVAFTADGRLWVWGDGAEEIGGW